MKPPGREKDPKAVSIPHPAHSLVVKDIKAQFLQGISYEAISAYLTERYPTPSGIPVWSKQTIRKILGNPFYAGKVSFGRRLTVNDARNNIKRLVNNPTPYLRDGAHIPLYPWSDYLLIEAEFSRRSDIPSTARYPWSGMLFCGQCGYRMRRKQGRYSCLHCYQVTIHDDDLPRILPPAIQSALRDLDPADEAPASPFASNVAAVHELDKQRKRVQAAYESGVYSIQEAEVKIKDIEAKIKKLRETESQHARQEAERVAFQISYAEAQELLDDLPEWMMSDDPKEVNRLLLRLIRQIKITPDGKAIPVLRN